MGQVSEIALRIVIIGAGATLVTDLWNLLLRRLGASTLDFAFLGRWVGHIPQGRWFHLRIADAAPVRGERWLGWGLHYGIGVAFAALAVALLGFDWARHPSAFPALAFGIATVVAPFFILQPALGAGVASSKTPAPFRNRLKSIVNHAVFGSGLYLAALAAARLFPA